MKLISLIAFASLGSSAMFRRTDDAPAYQNTTDATPGNNYTSAGNSTAQDGSSYNATKPAKAEPRVSNGHSKPKKATLRKKTVTTTTETSESSSSSLSSTTTSSHFYTTVVKGRKRIKPKTIQSAPTNSSGSGDY